MSLPAAARKQVKEAEKLYAEVYGEDGSGAAEGGEQPPAAASQDSGDADQPVVPSAPSVEPEVKPDVVAEGDTPAPADPTPITPEVDWEHRYKTLQGKYNAEMPRLHQQIRELQAAMERVQEAQQAPPEPEEEAPIGVTAKEVEEYGQDFIDVVRRVADAQVAGLRAENQKLKQQVDGMNTNLVKSDRQKMVSQLANEVPNWEDINTDDGFLAWLDHVDPYSGEQRLQMLHTAFEANDAPRTIAFFKGFLNENAAIAPPVSKPQVAGTPVPKINPETLVAPGRASESVDTRAQEGSAKKIWPEQEISDFYSDVRRGKYKGKPKDQARIEADIIAAGREGRIR